MAQTSSFYELAALLLPILMLSGYVTQRLPKPSVFTHSTWRSSLVIVGFVVFPVLAEISALATVMVGKATPSYSAWLVGLALAFGLWSVAVAWSWSWLRSVWTFGTKLSRTLNILCLVLVVCATGAFLRAGAAAQDEGRRLRDTLAALAEPRPFALTVVVSEQQLQRLDAQERLLDAMRQEKRISGGKYLRMKRDVQRKREKALDDRAVAEIDADTRRDEFDAARLNAALTLGP